MSSPDYYPGKIARVNILSNDVVTFDIDYDDGDKERGVRRSFIRKRCQSVMCSVGVHGGWKASDQGEAPGCAMEWVPDGILNPADGGEPQWQRYHDERKFYCHDHAPAGSHPLRTL